MGEQKRGQRDGNRDDARRDSRRKNFYADLCTSEELAILADAGPEGAPRDALDDEVALLRVLIRRAAEARPEGPSLTRLEVVGRAIERLARTLKARRLLRDDAAKEPGQTMTKILEELMAELKLRPDP